MKDLFSEREILVLLDFQDRYEFTFDEWLSAMEGVTGEGFTEKSDVFLEALVLLDYLRTRTEGDVKAAMAAAKENYPNVYSIMVMLANLESGEPLD